THSSTSSLRQTDLLDLPWPMMRARGNFPSRIQLQSVTLETPRIRNTSFLSSNRNRACSNAALALALSGSLVDLFPALIAAAFLATATCGTWDVFIFSHSFGTAGQGN